MSDPDEPAVKVTLGVIYEQLLAVRDDVRELKPLPPRVEDHEARLRQIEEREDLTRRVVAMEQRIENLQRLVWALPAPALLVAVIAIALPIITSK